MQVEMVEIADRGELALIARTEKLMDLPTVRRGLSDEERAIAAGYDETPIDYESMVTPDWPYTSCWIFNKTKERRGLERLLRVVDGEEEA